MQCAYNLVPSNLNVMILVIALEQQELLFHVESATQSEVTQNLKLIYAERWSTQVHQELCTVRGQTL